MDPQRPVPALVRYRKIAGGFIDYWRYPGQRTKWGGPFNDQVERQRIFHGLLDGIPFQYIVETGTFRGTTTEYLHRQSGLPVHTVEVQPRKFGFSWARFASNRQVKVAFGDSRAFLRRLAAQDLSADKPVFFYLDAHWSADLPLAEEIGIVFDRWPRAVVMVDDFRVPGDDGYGYDDYGTGKVLEAAYLEESGHGGLARYFPAAASAQETGKRRGCVVLANDAGLVALLDGLSGLRRPERQ